MKYILETLTVASCGVCVLMTVAFVEAGKEAGLRFQAESLADPVNSMVSFKNGECFLTDAKRGFRGVSIDCDANVVARLPENQRATATSPPPRKDDGWHMTRATYVGWRL